MAITNCDNKAQTLDELFRDIITIDDAGNAAIRVTNSVDSGVPFVACDNKNITMEEIIKSLVIADCDGKPALNLAAFVCP